ncbi:cytochrome c3 family protein [Arenibacter sp. F20364]|uniref:cytochrome c3 family protein n=1 Tax=Arenibacter sp. F20364 TaxID=2926415 RepID=UPI001FF6BDF4|nr:cytochrome c3 family protein [Arenibacter sp. F20364]MCK0192042.1 cytochrome c family protein [Arenibacter sp. F20364]
MKSISIYTALLVLLTIYMGYGQISPGDLTKAHADLEGMSNCTQCHDLGNKVTDKKCLECHKEIQSLVNKKQGLHGQTDVIKQDCFQCHSEHHGRKFDMIHLDEDAFDHESTGYELAGAHETVDCRKCHISENIVNNDLKQREKTYLGLDETCLSCHDDYHQKTLASNCVDCHDMEAFKPAPKFDHDQADFQLSGEHSTVDCIECHKMTVKNGKEFQEFTDIPFEDCISCHEDPHDAKIPGQCAQCHTETSFATFSGQDQFDHNLTDFTLKGSHQKTDCFSCHSRSSEPLQAFQDRNNINENSCVKCHKDVHEGKFGTDCVKCHRETSFLALRSMDFFDHGVTDYPLEGKHVEVDCKQCHKKRFTTPIDFGACTNCHVDYHKGEFIKNGVSPDCVQCHSLEKGFDYSLFTLEQHKETEFPLEGAHIATPCFSCHVSEGDDRWTFRNMGANCVDCHQDVHEGYISEKYYPNDDCTRCHANDAWSSVNFDHNKTDWPLTGKHTEVECRACHFNELTVNEPIKGQKFANLESNCATCHENIHDDTFAIDRVTDCKRCHITSSWFPEAFNHDLTNFPLEGRHAKIQCSACHEIANANGEVEVVYKIQKFRCIDCHLQ